MTYDYYQRGEEFASEPELIEDPVQVLCDMREDDEDGDCFTNHTLILVPEGWTDADIREELKSRFPVWRCEHSYDCCGHFYPSNPTFTRLTGYGQRGHVLVSQGFHCNI